MNNIQDLIVNSILCIGLIMVYYMAVMPSKESTKIKKQDNKLKKLVDSNYKKIVNSIKK